MKETKKSLEEISKGREEIKRLLHELYEGEKEAARIVEEMRVRANREVKKSESIVESVAYLVIIVILILMIL